MLANALAQAHPTLMATVNGITDTVYKQIDEVTQLDDVDIDLLKEQFDDSIMEIKKKAPEYASDFKEMATEEVTKKAKEFQEVFDIQSEIAAKKAKWAAKEAENAIKKAKKHAKKHGKYLKDRMDDMLDSESSDESSDWDSSESDSESDSDSWSNSDSDSDSDSDSNSDSDSDSDDEDGLFKRMFNKIWRRGGRHHDDDDDEDFDQERRHGGRHHGKKFSGLKHFFKRQLHMMEPAIAVLKTMSMQYMDLRAKVFTAAFITVPEKLAEMHTELCFGVDENEIRPEAAPAVKLLCNKNAKIAVNYALFFATLPGVASELDLKNFLEFYIGLSEDEADEHVMYNMAYAENFNIETPQFITDFLDKINK